MKNIDEILDNILINFCNMDIEEKVKLGGTLKVLKPSDKTVECFIPDLELSITGGISAPDLHSSDWIHLNPFATGFIKDVKKELLEYVQKPIRCKGFYDCNDRGVPFFYVTEMEIINYN